LGTAFAPVPKVTPLGGNHVLVAEFVVCMVVVGIGPLLNQVDSPGAWLKKGAAVTGLFFVLSLIASGEVRSSKIAAAFGGLVTLGLLINDRALFARLVEILGGGDEAPPEEDVSEIGDVLGE
jgi:hypothetical protein